MLNWDRMISGASFKRALIPLIRALPSWTNHLLKVSPQILSHWELDFSIWIWGGTHSDHNKDFPMKPATKGYSGSSGGFQTLRYQTLSLSDFYFLSRWNHLLPCTLGCLLATLCSSPLSPRPVFFPTIYSQEVSIGNIWQLQFYSVLLYNQYRRCNTLI